MDIVTSAQGDGRVLALTIFQNTEVAQNITFYFLDNRKPRVEVVALIQKVVTQAKSIRYTDKTCK